jgi:hypothetical protein
MIQGELARGRAPRRKRGAVTVLRIVLTIVLLAETLPSAVAGIMRARAGLTRLDGLARLGLLEGRNRWVASLLGVLHLAGSALVIAGIPVPAVGVAGAALEAVIFGWVLSRQLQAGDRGRSLFAYLLFTAMALAVLIVDLVH